MPISFFLLDPEKPEKIGSVEKYGCTVSLKKTNFHLESEIKIKIKAKGNCS